MKISYVCYDTAPAQRLRGETGGDATYISLTAVVTLVPVVDGSGDGSGDEGGAAGL